MSPKTSGRGLQPSAERALKSILPLIEAQPPDYYSAHQKARTTASRLCKPPTSKKPDYAGAVDVLFESSKELLKRREQGSGVDLGSYMIEVYDTSGVALGDVERGRLTQLLALTGANGRWRKVLGDKAIAWSAKIGPHSGGDPELHRYIAELLYKEGSFALALPRFLQAATRDSSRVFGQMMAEWYLSTDGTTSAGAFATHGVIPFLLLGSIVAASSFLSSFLSTLTSRSSTIFFPEAPIPVKSGRDILQTKDSTLNFLQLAIPTCQRAQQESSKLARESWVRLCGTYQSRGGLLATPDYRRALQDIATLYFGFPAPKTAAANPFGDMMAGLFGGGPSEQPAPRKLAPVAMQVDSAGLD